MYINRPNQNEVGLFGHTDGSSIENMGIVDCNIVGYEYVGGLVGDNTSSTISNSYSTGKVHGYNHFGGLVGYNTNSTISNSYSTVEVTGKYRVGGLVGSNYHYSTIDNSYATGKVHGIFYIGGLVGTSYDHSTIDNSYATGNVSGENSVGGLIGYNNSYSTVRNSYATGNVSGESSVGGLVGCNTYTSTVANSYATGNVSGKNYVGGLAGSNDYGSKVRNSYSTGDVTRKAGSTSNKFGSFCGEIFTANGYDDVIMEYCYSTGSVYYDGNLPPTGKGFVGYENKKSQYTDNYFDSQASNQNTAIGADAKNTTQMKSQGTYPASWNFGQGGMWTMDPNLNDGYPAHQWADDSEMAVESFAPADNAGDYAVDDDLVINFDETVVKGNGNIRLYNSDDDLIETFDVATSDLVTVVADTSLVINPTYNLSYGTSYYLQIDNTCFDDASGNNYAGIADETTWNFSVGCTNDVLQMNLDVGKRNFYSLTKELDVCKLILKTFNQEGGTLLFISNATSNNVFVRDNIDDDEVQIHQHRGTMLMWDSNAGTNGAWVVIK